MYIEKIINNVKLPPVYNRNNKPCYYDPFRQKLIPVTPEEKIRQQIAIWFVENKNVPIDKVILEQHLSHYCIDSKDRADIIIHRDTEEGLLPIAVVECKAPTVAISDMVLEQCFGYAIKLHAKYAIVTNGIDIISYVFNEDKQQFFELSEIPSYSEMTSNQAVSLFEYEVIPRPSYDEMFDVSTQQGYIDDYIIGSRTSVDNRGHAINILEALLDEEHTITTCNRSFQIVDDLGVRILNYGNAAGFDYVAPYRSFLIKDSCGNHQIVSVGFNAYGNDKTILCVAIDDYKKSHHSLQLLIDTYMKKSQDKLLFTHSGKISIGHSGSGCASDLMNYVKERSSLIIKDGTVVLGEILCVKLLSFEDLDFCNFILNLIEYALLRDGFRVNKKRG